MADWSAEAYLEFGRERTRPVRDLLAAVPTADPKTAIDLGCGPGNSTEVLLARYPNAAVTGIDSSPAMIDAARRRLPAVRFERADIASWQTPDRFDVILSNAVLQWLPHHGHLLPRLVARLAPGGSLAIQIPDNLAEPAQTLMREIAADGPWASRLAGAEAARTSIESVVWYHRLLRPLAARVEIWRTVYHHPLTGGADGIVRWFRSTGLKPFLDPLDDGDRVDFLARYRRALAAAYPAEPDGTVLLPFPRLFFVVAR